MPSDSNSIHFDRALGAGSAFALGAAGLWAQVALGRRVSAIWGGNELILGLFLCDWLLLTALGAAAGRWVVQRFQKAELFTILCFLSLPAGFIFSVAGAGWISGSAQPGAQPEIQLAFWALPLLLSLTCLPVGAIFTGLISGGSEANTPGRAFYWETVGAAIAGGALSLALAGRVSSLETSRFLIVLCVAVSIGLWSKAQRPKGVALSLLSLIGSWLLLSVLQDAMAIAIPAEKVLERVESPYGSLAATENRGESEIYLGPAPLFAAWDPEARQRTVGPALAQRASAGEVLLLGAQACALGGEVKDRSPDSLTCALRDPDLARFMVELGIIDPEWAMRIEIDDPRAALGRMEGLDFILSILPPPSTLGDSRFFSQRYFEIARAALKPEGVLVVSLPNAENYSGQHQSRLLSSVWRAMKAAFPHTRFFSGPTLLMMGSAAPLEADLGVAFFVDWMGPEAIDPTWLADRESPERRRELLSALESYQRPNLDFAPHAYLAQLQHWLIQFGHSPLGPLLFLALLLFALTAAVSTGPNPALARSTAATGAVGMGAQILLLLAYQTANGGLWRDLGWLFGAFMIGAALGAHLANRKGGALAFRIDLLATLLGGGLAAVFALAPPEARHAVFQPIPVAALLALAGGLVGAQYPTSVALGGKASSARLYAADLIGSATAAVVVPLVMVPMLGYSGAAIGLALTKAPGLLHRPRVSAPTEESANPRRFGSVFVVAGFLAVIVLNAPDSIRYKPYAFSFSDFHVWTVFLSLAAVVWMAWFPPEGKRGLVKRLGDLSRNALGFSRGAWLAWMALIAYAVFSLTTFMPLARCYFKVPWVFCHVCPRQCVFGYMRPYMVGGALIANLGPQPWCQRICPVGTLLDTAGGRKPNARLKRWLWPVRVLVLLAVVVIYFAVKGSAQREMSFQGPLFLFFHRNAYAMGAGVLAVSALFYLASRRTRRSFCETACPVGTCSDLIDAGMRRFVPPANEGRK